MAGEVDAAVEVMHRSHRWTTAATRQWSPGDVPLLDELDPLRRTRRSRRRRCFQAKKGERDAVPTASQVAWKRTLTERRSDRRQSSRSRQRARAVVAPAIGA